MRFVYRGVLTVSYLGVWTWDPETKVRTFKEVDWLFEVSVNPRKFRVTKLVGF